MVRYLAFAVTPASGACLPSGKTSRPCRLPVPRHQTVTRCVLHSNTSKEESASRPVASSNEQQTQNEVSDSPADGHPNLYTSSTVPISKLPPMLQHFVRTKRDRPDFLLLYRVGDFYETFFEDASAFSAAADIALTSKPAGRFLERVPMAGVPHFSLDDKIKILLDQGLKVAVCDQVGAVVKGGLVERRVTRIITPGTLNGDGMIEGQRNNFLACIRWIAGKGGLSVVDVSTGELELISIDSLNTLLSTLSLYTPAEVLVSDFMDDAVAKKVAKIVKVITIRREQDFAFLNARQKVKERFRSMNVVDDLLLESCGGLLSFIEETMEIEAQIPISDPIIVKTEEKLFLDDGAIRNLEIVSTIRDGKRYGSLLWAVDRTTTSMGSRTLRRMLLAPLTSVADISNRHDAVDFLLKNHDLRGELRKMLKRFSDLERISGRLSQRRCPRDLRMLAESLLRLPSLLSLLSSSCDSLPELLESLQRVIADSRLFVLGNEIDQALNDPAPIAVGPVGAEVTYRVFKEGYDKTLDHLCQLKSTQLIRELEHRERERTKLSSLKIRRIRNSGYSISIPRSVAEKLLIDDASYFAKLDYDRTLSTKLEMRFKSAELNQREEEADLASSRVVKRELELFDALREELNRLVSFIRVAGRAIAMLDVLAAFADLAIEKSYTRPKVLPFDDHKFRIVQGRHPVVEQTVDIVKGFIPNDVSLSGNDNSEQLRSSQAPDFLVLTGPNASGKSIYLRMSGLLTILSQAGSFVPAGSATISVIDRIFTRVGASDDVGKGLSTFQVEMNETATILDGATENSLILLDEVGCSFKFQNCHKCGPNFFSYQLH